MDTRLRILIVESTEEVAARLAAEMDAGGYSVTYRRVAGPVDMEEALDTEGWDVVLADYGLAGFRGLSALALLRRRDVDLPFIIVSDPQDEQQAVMALKLGAQDCVTRTSLARLVPAVERALREATERRARRDTEAALRASEERYRLLVENANDVVFTTDLRGGFTSLNTAGEQISGYLRREVVRMNMADVLTPESLQVARKMIEQKLAGTPTTTYELELIAKDGHRVPLEASTRLIVHGGKPVGIQGIARDITERKRAAEALAESEQRYRGLFENASDLVYTHDLAGNIKSINQASERMTGYTRDEALHLNIREVVAADHLKLAWEMVQTKLAEGGPTTYELDILTKNGERKALEINSQLIYQESRPVGVQGIARDITERRRAEEELRAREHKQAVAAELGQHALASNDLDSLFHDAATCIADTLHVDFCTVLELSPGGKSLRSRAGIGWKPGLIGQASVAAGLRSQAGFALVSSEPVIVEDMSVERRFSVPKILREYGVTSGLSVIIHGQPAPFGVLSAFTKRPRSFSQDDVHFLRSVANVLATAIQRKRLEDERALHNKVLAARVLQAHEEERKRIARELHDETAQSLSVLLTNLDLLEPHIPAEGPLRSGFERVGALARRTLDETRALSHDLRPTILDDAGLVAALQWLGAEYEQTYGASVEVNVVSGVDVPVPPEVELALFRIAQEALTNCGKHSGASRVSLSLSFTGGKGRLVVRDNGTGFDPHRVAGPTRAGRLGLYGMHERANLLGGALHVSASPGKGTRIRAEIPLPVSTDEMMQGEGPNARVG